MLTQLVNVFLNVLTVGTGNLSAETQWLLRLFIGIELVTCAAFWFWAQEQIISLLAFKVIRIGLFALFVLNWLFLTSLFRDSMLWAASQLGGGVITVETFLDPSALASSGYVATEPIWKWIKNTTGVAAVLNVGTTLMFTFALWATWAAYNLTAINMSICLIIFQFLAAFMLIFIAFGGVHRHQLSGRAVVRWGDCGLDSHGTRGGLRQHGLSDRAGLRTAGPQCGH